MTLERKAPPRSVIAVKEALRQERQLTSMERMQAEEILSVMRHNACLHFGTPAPDKRPTDDDPPEVTLLKRRGLYEIVKYARANPDAESDFVVALVDEAAHDFGRNARHRKGVPANVAAATKARANMTEMQRMAERLRALEGASSGQASAATGSSDDVSDERLDALEARLGALETLANALDSAVTALENAQTAPLDGATEKGSVP